jgi:hypothetical protein
MAIKFNGGGAQATPGFEGYCSGKQWNDPTLLFPPNCNDTTVRFNQWLQQFNTEAIIKGMLEKVPVASRGLGQYNTVRQWVEADEEKASILVLKGLHQWTDKYSKAHISIGYEGYLWHLYARFQVRPQTMIFNGDITCGGYQAHETHDGWTVVKR